MHSLPDISRRYEYIKDRSITCFLISHETLEKFFSQKSLLDPTLKEASDDNRMRALKGLLNNLAFEYANCPLPLNSEFFYRDDRIQKIKNHVEKCAQAYPSIKNKLDALLITIEDIRMLSDNPILQSIQKEIGFKDVSLILANPDYSHAVIEMCEKTGIRLSVNVPGIPSAMTSKGVFCGCARFFASHHFWAPTYSKLHLVRFSWFSDHLINSPLLQGQPSNMNTPKLVVQKQPANTLQTNIPELNNLIEDFDITLLERYKQKEASDGSFDIVDAKVVILRSGKFVFLPAADDYRHHCIVNLDIFENGQPAIKKLSLSEFNEHTAILLKEKTGEDYVFELANKILSTQVEILRNCQKQWKLALRNQIKLHGITELSKKLNEIGCKTGSSHQNLRNWASPRFIRPDSQSDFVCLLKFLGLESQSALIIKSMNTIRAAHIGAGHEIGKQLRKLAESDSNLRHILIDGYRVYRTSAGGKLGVYMFERSLEQNIPVHYTEIGNLKTIEALYG